ncbi:hypothetical protein ACVNP0_16645 [Staphylococcus aureus]
MARKSVNRLQEVDKAESNDTELSYTESNNTEINDMNDLNDIESENEISNHSSQCKVNSTQTILTELKKHMHFICAVKT